MPVIAVTIVDQTVGVTQVGEIGLTGPTGPTGTVSAAGDGTAGAPGIAFASDTNTGLFLAGSDILAVATGGVERVRFNASGKAEFTGNQSLSLSTGPTLTLSRTDSFDSNPSAVMASLLFKSHFDVIDNAKIYTVGTGSGYTGQLRFATNDGTGALLDRVSVTPTGDVGIGTTSPATLLHVYGSGNPGTTIESTSASGIAFLKLKNSTTNANWNVEVGRYGSSDSLGFYNGVLGAVMTILPGGNVGIGTVAPDAQLHVQGVGQASSGTFTTSSGLGGSILLNDTTDATNRGGAVVFSAADFRFAAIKGLLTGGTGNGVGDLAFYTRTAAGNSTLAEKMRINKDGNVGIGTTSPTRQLTISGGNAYMNFTATNSPGRNVTIGTEGDNNRFVIFDDTAAAYRLIIDSSGHITPGVSDNVQNFGSGSYRWATIYAGTGTINTSDERYKVLREGGDLSDAEYRAWSNVRAIVYQDKDSFERKGSAARLHVGYSWQSIQAAFEAEGLDAARYGLWCEDALEAPVEKTRMVSRPVEGQTETIPVLDDEGQPVFEQVQETEEVEQPFEEVRMIDGAPVLVKGVRTVAQPVFDNVQIRDEDGELIFDTPQPIEDPETGELVEGDPVPRMAPVPRMISKAKTETVPVMEEVEETFTEMEPTGETRGALRYNQCSVIEAAWLRRELAALTARLSALEAA